MNFSDFDLHPEIVKSIEKLGFTECTPIQSSVIPHALNGKDVAGLAQTGTGKTAAFAIPLIDRILRSQDPANRHKTTETVATAETVAAAAEARVGIEAGAAEEKSLGSMESMAPAISENKGERFFRDWRPQHFVLVLVPTRELADQVTLEIIKLKGDTSIKAASVYGGTSYDKQISDIKGGAEFIVGTPGRLIDLYKSHNVDFRQVRAIVFDEADRMFDMGFRDDMRYILQRVPKNRQFLVFSATLNFEVMNVAYTFGADPIECNVSRDQAKAENVKDEIFHVGQFDKPQHLLSLIKKRQPKQMIVFSNFKHNVERIARFLTSNNYPAMGISSLLTQNQRNRVMEQFRAVDSGQNILVATDVAARGLDIKGVDIVVNYELPDDPENYVHRIGRTGRAGEEGHAFSFVGDRDVEALMRIEDYLKHKINIGWMDDTDLVKEFIPMPSDQDRRSRIPDQREGRSDNRSRGGRPDRGPRQDRGPRPDRGPRVEGQERTQGDRPRDDRSRSDRPRGEMSRSDRPRDDRPRGDRPMGDRPPRHERSARDERPRGIPRDDRPRDDRSRSDRGGRPSDRPARSAEGTQLHRDRRTGRHGPNSGDSQSKAGPREPSHSGNHRGPRSHNRGRGGQQQQRHAPAAQRHAAKAAPTIGKKITGFIKKIFGSGPAKTKS